VNEHREFNDLLFGKFEMVGRELANQHRLELSDFLPRKDPVLPARGRAACLAGPREL